MTYHIFKRNGGILGSDGANGSKAHGRDRPAIGPSTHATFLCGVNDCASAFDVGFVHLVRIAHPQAIIGGHVEHKLTARHGVLERSWITQVAACYFSAQLSNVFRSARRAHQQAQPSAALRQSAGHVAADESSGSCDERFHVLFSLSRAQRGSLSLQGGQASAYPIP